MKKFFSAITALVLICQSASAGSDVRRYRDIVFREVKMDSVAYCTHGHRPLYMDIYQPVGDTATQRPLVILAHGGSFIHGDRHSDLMPAICRELAMRGYVAVSIDYRLTNMLAMASRRGAYDHIIRSVADGRSSVRWFISDIAKGNSYRIDRRRIFFGGSSAGGILAEQLAFIDSAGECDPVLRSVVKEFLPDSGALPPHSLRGCISLAGAVLDTSLIGPDQPSLLHIQGDADNIVPFTCKRPVGGIAPFLLSGLGASRPRYASQGLDYSEYVFSKEGHTPWNYDSKALSVVIEQMVDFLGREIK